MTAVFRLSLIVMSFVLAGALTACGQGFKASTIGDDAGRTGARNKEGLPYTAASDSDELESLKHSIDPSLKPNLTLAASIEKVSVSRLDSAGNAVSTSPAQLEIGLTIAGKASNFRAVLTNAGALPEAREVTAGGTDLKLNLRCLDAACASVEIRLSVLSSGGGTGSPAEAGLIYRERLVKAEALGPYASTGAQVSRLAALAKNLGAAAKPLLKTSEVAWGPAIFDLTSGDLQIFGDLIATGGTESNVTVNLKSLASLEARLLGNSNRGDILVRVSEGAAWSFVRITVAKSVSSTRPTAPVADDDTPASERFIPFDPTNSFTRELQKDLTRPEIQALIPEIKSRFGIASFLNRVAPNLPVIVNAMKTKNVPPELLFITLIESNFFTSPGFPIWASRTDAVGPWQFMPGTAQGYGLKIRETHVVAASGKVKAHREGHRCDDRADLNLSSLAAAKYFRYLLDLFPDDPRLAIMAYNGGEGRIGKETLCGNDKVCRANYKPRKLTERLRDAQTARLDYWTIRELNMAPNESIQYVARFVAAQFVGREPSRYGITVATTGFPLVPQACQ